MSPLSATSIHFTSSEPVSRKKKVSFRMFAFKGFPLKYCSVWCLHEPMCLPSLQQPAIQAEVHKHFLCNILLSPPTSCLYEPIFFLLCKYICSCFQGNYMAQFTEVIWQAHTSQVVRKYDPQHSVYTYKINMCVKHGLLHKGKQTD